MRSSAAILIGILVTCQGAPAASEEIMLLKGRVIGPDQQPVPGAKITIHDEEAGTIMTVRCDRQGKFAAKHSPCSFFSFEVIPPGKSNLSRAHYRHLNGDAGKHFIVQLQRGFSVSGRVVADGAALQGLSVKASGDDTGQRTHAGGITRTGRNGEYHLILTPGQKIIEVRNNKYRDFASVATRQVTINGDVRLPDISLQSVNTHDKLE